MPTVQKNFRAKERLEKAERQKEKNDAIKSRSGPGQPLLVDSQPALLETIINIAIHGNAADGRRRTEMIRSCLTLSDLHERLLLMGLKISRSGIYLHLLPHVSNTQEGNCRICRWWAGRKSALSESQELCHSTLQKI